MIISLGTWQIAPSDGFWIDQNLLDSENVIKEAVKLNIRSFDTAQSYGKGQAEQTLSKILSRYPNKEFFIDTKIMPTCKSVSDIVKISESRLKKLSINCLYLHWPKSNFDNISFLKNIEKLKVENRIKKLGICNIELEDLKKILASNIKIDRFQRPLSLLWSKDMEKTISFCKENNIELAIYSPLGMGLLSGNYREKNDLKDARRNLFCFDQRCHKEYLNLLDTISSIALKNNLSMAQVSLAWTISKKVDVLILGARNTNQLKLNLSYLDTCLDESALKSLDEAALLLDNASKNVCSNIFNYSW